MPSKYIILLLLCQFTKRCLERIKAVYIRLALKNHPFTNINLYNLEHCVGRWSKNTKIFPTFPTPKLKFHFLTIILRLKENQFLGPAWNKWWLLRSKICWQLCGIWRILWLYNFLRCMRILAESNYYVFENKAIHNIQLASLIPERSPFYDMISGHFDLKKNA